MRAFTTFFTSLLTGLLLVTGPLAMAQSGPDPLRFNDPWLRGSVPGQKNGAGYVTIHNTGARPLALLSVQSDRADRVELHTVIREGGVTKMREVTEINIPAAGSVKLAPGGYHIMFIGLNSPFQAGETISLQLSFEGGYQDKVDFTVKPPTYTGESHKLMKGQ